MNDEREYKKINKKNLHFQPISSSITLNLRIRIDEGEYVRSTLAKSSNESSFPTDNEIDYKTSKNIIQENHINFLYL